MKKRILVRLLFLLVTLFFSNLLLASTEKEQYLLVQYAPSASIKHDEKSNTYTITLKDVSPYVTYFAERPVRKSGLMSLKEYMELWKHKHPDNFTINPPNANLNAVETHAFQKTEHVNFTAILTNPIYDEKEKTLSYNVKPLKGNLKPIKETDVDYIAIFIDDVCLSCW